MEDFDKIIHYRSITADDADLLRRIYASTREDEMALVTHWSDQEKQAFLEHQFMAQHTYYQQNYGTGSFRIILANDQAAGRLYLFENADELRIIDIALLPEFRNKGYGGYILQNLLRQAASHHQLVKIHVERHNRALYLYERLGFEVKDDSNEIYLLMEWKSPETTT